MGEERFAPVRIMAALRAAGVEFVLVGDLALMARDGRTMPTSVEIRVRRDDDVPARLSGLLTPLGVVPTSRDGEPHRRVCRTLVGDVECVELEDAAFRDLQARASDMSFDHGVIVRVGAPRDLAAQGIAGDDLVGAVRASAAADGATAAAAPSGSERVRFWQRQHEDDDEYGPQPSPKELGPLRRIGRAFEEVDRFMIDITGGSAKPRG
ncbi:MAG: hypothetical protein QOI81_1845 [Actinomycetota bacterium]|jgi:hypothetical protein|nr:hypothetical protein [Actinomycetota bacterium]